MAELTTSVQDGPERAYAAFAVVDSLSLASVHEANVSFLAVLSDSSGSGAPGRARHRCARSEAGARA